MNALVSFACPRCGKLTDKSTSAFNRALRKGIPIYCGSRCAGSAGMADLNTRFERGYIPEPNSGCWLWAGKLNSYGYGLIALTEDGKLKELKAHQIAYRIHVGAIPEGLELDHKCRVRCCVNPHHLEPVTRRENIRRGVSPAALNMVKTHCPQGHEYTDSNTRVGRKGSRICRECHRARERARSSRRRA